MVIDVAFDFLKIVSAREARKRRRVPQDGNTGGKKLLE